MKEKNEKHKTFLNIGALIFQGLKEKIDYPEIVDVISTCGIFGISESWLGEGDRNFIGVENIHYHHRRLKCKNKKSR